MTSKRHRKYTVSIILGTRPEAIKLAPIILAFARRPEVVCRVCVTGQHRQMLDQVLRVFEIEPDRDLNLMRRNQTLGGFTARALRALDSYLAEARPDMVLVQGDTTTVFCAALTAFYHRIPVGHVEAGLRTWDMDAPWPEEANRVLTSRLAAVHFAPTAWSRDNLLREGVAPGRIVVTGNPVVDALLIARRKTRARPPAVPELPPAIQPGTRCGRPPVVLITGHRRESFGAGFEQICRAIAELARTHPDVQFVYPVHLNPHVREPVLRILGTMAATRGAGRGRRRGSTPPEGSRNIHLIEPLSYLPFVAMMDRATLILTDSGGVQEEAPSLGKPVLVMRSTTERPEGVRAGVVKLVGVEEHAIVSAAAGLLKPCTRRADRRRTSNPYGDGHAARRIVTACGGFLAEERVCAHSSQ